MDIELQQERCSPIYRLGSWNLLKELGSGATARVYLASDEMTGEQAAIKILTTTSEMSLSYLKTEAHVLRLLSDHPNALTILEVFEAAELVDVASGVKSQVHALVMEYAEKGEFFQFLNSKGNLDELTARHYFKQLINIIDYTHSKGVIHRDIKLENLLLDEDYNLKLADFGYASKLAKERRYTKAVGTSVYFAPEIHAGNSYSDEQADLFAAGIILFTMVAGHMPFSKAKSEDKIYNLLYQGDFCTFWAFHQKMMTKKLNKADYTFSKEFINLMSYMLAADCTKRLNVDEIKNHAWVATLKLPQPPKERCLSSLARVMPALQFSGEI